MKLTITVALLVCLHCAVQAAVPDYKLSDNIRIQSQILGYPLHYRLLAPANIESYPNLPLMFVTDGEKYLQQLNFDKEIVSLIQQQKISPLIAVFVDSRDPDDLTINRRHSQFMCNADYANFYRQEFVPQLEQQLQLQHSAAQRMIMGLSFGALNAGCFGILLPDLFGNLAMQSPASDKHVNILAKIYQDSPVSAVKMFITVGTRNDNTRAGRAFHRQLKQQGYDIAYHEVPYGHVWENWQSTLPLVLQWFAPVEPAKNGAEK